MVVSTRGFVYSSADEQVGACPHFNQSRDAAIVAEAAMGSEICNIDITSGNTSVQIGGFTHVADLVSPDTICFRTKHARDGIQR